MAFLLLARGGERLNRTCQGTDCNFSYIVASSKRRAIDTITAAARHLGIAPEIVPDLVEIDRNAKVHAPPPLLEERVTNAWQELLDRPRGERVAVGPAGGGFPPA